jgi:cleavage and polyadenylation specificity factor subunit 3
MMRLKSKLLSLNASLPPSRKVKVFSPRNCEDLRIPFKAEKIAKVVGKLANMPPTSLMPRNGLDGSVDKFDVNENGGRIITGVLVQDVFKLSLMAPEDLREYAGLTTTVVMCKQRVRLSAAGIALIRWALESTFGSIEEIESSRDTTQDPQSNRNGDVHMNGNGTLDDIDEEIGRLTGVTYLVMGCVTVRWSYTGEVDLEWEGNLLNDGVADAVLAVLSTVESSPAAVKRKRQSSFLVSQLADTVEQTLQPTILIRTPIRTILTS